ncbi:MAG: hypothetical protein IBJ10_05325 [Phycisphaerales bacterium]|nr:hypothetical protein [Phycisphaerales bacterium]
MPNPSTGPVVSRPARWASATACVIIVLMAALHMAGHLRTREPRTPEEASLRDLMGTVEFTFLGGRFTMNDARATLNWFYFGFAVLSAAMVVLAAPALVRMPPIFARVHLALALALVGTGGASMMHGFTMPGPAFLLAALLSAGAAVLAIPRQSPMP